MHLFNSSIRTSLAKAFQIPANVYSPSITSTCTTALARTQSRTPTSVSKVVNRIAPFSSTSSQLARKKVASRKDRRVTLIRYFLHHPSTLIPRPLRLSRTRSLRHWTIHRAWQLYTHKLKSERLASLERQYNAMRDACEELRVGAGDGGRLFRKAMMKTGVFAVDSVPMEYTRGLVDYVGTVDGQGNAVRIWDSNWKR